MLFPTLGFVDTSPVKQFKLSFYPLPMPFSLLFIFLLLLSYELPGLATSTLVLGWQLWATFTKQANALLQNYVIIALFMILIL